MSATGKPVPVLGDIDPWTMFEQHFAKAFPSGECAEIAVKFITADGELAAVTITRHGFTARLEEFEEPDAEYDGEEP